MVEKRVCLVVTFNSPFVANIPILLDLYTCRFDSIFFLTHKPEGYPNALMVEGKSFYFHNFFLQNCEQIQGFDYYVFTHDDAVLHPGLNKRNLWTRFSIPDNAICVRNIDIVPRDSPWNWAWQGGYDIVDTHQGLKDLLIQLSSQMRKNFQKYVLPYQCSKYKQPDYVLSKCIPPVLFGGGANADLMFMPAQAMNKLMECIALLNYPGFFVEIVVPMAILLTDWPVYLLSSGKHAPIHYPKGKFILPRLAIMALLDRISYHPIKFGMAHPSTRKLFVQFYHILNRTEV